MKKLIIIISVLFIQLSFSQACGIYKLKYKGTIKSKFGNEFKIQLPSSYFFHTKDKKESPMRFYDYKFRGTEIQSTFISHLTSLHSSNQLIKLYKTNRDFIPLMITVINSSGVEKQQSIKVAIKDLKFEGLDISGKPTQIIINLGEINL